MRSVPEATSGLSRFGWLSCVFGILLGEMWERWSAAKEGTT